MQRVRMPRAAAMADCLLTMRHFRYGGLPLSDSGNPLVKAANMVARAYCEAESIEWGDAKLACNTKAAANVGSLAVHVDSASRRTEGTAELLTTSWAQCVAGLPREQQRDLYQAAELQTPLLSKTLFLRRSIAMDVYPCEDIAIVAGTEDEHGVLSADGIAGLSAGADIERGLTRSMAQSCRVDADSYGNTDASAYGIPRRHKLRRPAQPAPAACPVLPGAEALRIRQVPAGAGRQYGGGGRNRQQPARFVPNQNVQPGRLPYHQLNAAPGGGYGRARINRVTGTGY